MTEDEKRQLDKFKAAAHSLECDDNDQTFHERLAVIARQKLKPEKPGA